MYSISFLITLLCIAADSGITFSFMVVIVTSTNFYLNVDGVPYAAGAVGIYYIMISFLYGTSIMSYASIVITKAHRYTRLVTISIALSLTCIIFWVLPFLTIQIKRSDIAHTSTETLECLPIGHIYQNHLGGITCMQKIEELVPNTNNFFNLNNNQLNWVTYTYIVYWFMVGSFVIFYVLFLVSSKYSQFHFTNNLAILSWVLIFITVALLNFTTRSIYAKVGTSTTNTYVGPSFFVQVILFVLVLLVDLGFLIFSKIKHKHA